MHDLSDAECVDIDGGSISWCGLGAGIVLAQVAFIPATAGASGVGLPFTIFGTAIACQFGW